MIKSIAGDAKLGQSNRLSKASEVKLGNIQDEGVMKQSTQQCSDIFFFQFMAESIFDDYI